MITSLIKKIARKILKPYRLYKNFKQDQFIEQELNKEIPIGNISPQDGSVSTN